MEKKIIAIALVLVVMVTAFVGCGQKYKTTKIGGEELLLATDAEGNTIVEENQLAVVVTNNDGEPITFGNGEPQTYYVNVPGSIPIDGIMYGSNFTLKLLDGWTSTDVDRINKDKTDNKCYIHFSETYVLEKDEKFEDALTATDKSNEELMNIINDEAKLKELIKTNPDVEKYLGGKCTIDKSSGVFTADTYPCRIYKFKIVDKDGKVIHYVETLYFLVDKTVYNISYACVDGVGYDAEFDFVSYVKENFTFVKTK